MSNHRHAHEEQIANANQDKAPKDSIAGENVFRDYLQSYSTYNRAQSEQSKDIKDSASLPQFKILNDHTEPSSDPKLQNQPKEEHKQSVQEIQKSGKPIEGVQSGPSHIETRGQKHPADHGHAKLPVLDITH